MTISQRPNGEYISLNEAHYICGIINSDIVNEFVTMSSDTRSFPINPRFQIPLYGIEKVKSIQEEISNISKLASENSEDKKYVKSAIQELGKLYLELLKNIE